MIHDNATAGVALDTSAASGGIGGGTPADAVIERTVIRDNHAPSDAATAGGLWIPGPFTLDHSEVRGNSAGDAGGIYSYDAHVTSSTIAENRSNRDGGFSGGKLTLTDSTLADNQGVRAGGGSGWFDLEHSVVSGNTASQFVGGLYGGGVVRDSAVVDNRAEDPVTHQPGGIGGIWADAGSSAGPPDLALDNSTVSGNWGGFVGGVLVSAEQYDLRSPEAQIVSSTLAGNVAALPDGFADLRLYQAPSATFAGGPRDGGFVGVGGWVGGGSGV